MFDDLEKYIDSHSVEQVLDIISKICYAKEQHVSEAWQDTRTATTWGKAGGMVYSLSRKVSC